MKRTKKNSALNLMVLAIPRNKAASPTIHCLDYFNTRDPDTTKYYSMFTADLGAGKVFLSSTFKDLGIKGMKNVCAAEFGTLFALS